MADSFWTRVQNDVAKYSGARQMVRANIIDLLTVRHLPPDKLHANPDDDFCNPKVGPNEEIVDKYIEEARRDMEVGEMSFDEAIMIASRHQGGPHAGARRRCQSGHGKFGGLRVLSQNIDTKHYFYCCAADISLPERKK